MPFELVPCPNCGLENSPGLPHCLNCGTNLTSRRGAAEGESERFTDLQQAHIHELVQQLSDAENWGAEFLSDGIRLMVPLPDGRRQHVVALLEDSDVEEGCVYLSCIAVCGSVRSDMALSLLRFNGRLKLCSLALRAIGEQEMLVVHSSLPASLADAEAVMRIIKEVARVGDSIEARLNPRSDRF